MKNATLVFVLTIGALILTSCASNKTETTTTTTTAPSPTGNWPAFTTGVVAWDVNSPALLTAGDIWQRRAANC